MNGVAPPNAPSPQQPPRPQPGPPPPAQANQGTSSRVSPALLHGAEKLSQLLDRRVNAVRAEYEEKLRVVTRERDALLSGHAIKPDAALYAELATHRAARETRAQEHARWAEENKKLAEEIKRLAEERDSLARSRDDRSNRLYEAEKEATRLFSEIEVMRSENEKLKRALAAASHAQTQPTRASEQPPSNPLEFIRSPTARSSTLPTLADSSITLSLSSASSTPNHHPDPSFSAQQVRSSPLADLALEDLITTMSSDLFSSITDSVMPAIELDDIHSSSPLMRSPSSPPPSLPMQHLDSQDVEMADAATAPSTQPSSPPTTIDPRTLAPPSPSTSTMSSSTTPRQLIIQAPQSAIKTRPPIKQRHFPVPGGTTEIVHVPRDSTTGSSSQSPQR